jgi:hypothetical protein
MLLLVNYQVNQLTNYTFYQLIFELDLNPNIDAVLCVSFVNGDERACILQQIHKHS